MSQTASPLKVIIVPAFSDNYLWLFHRVGETDAYIVDPGDAKPVLAALEQHGLTLAGILITHHHPDHTGGIDELLKHRQVPVYGPATGSVPQVDHPVTEGQALGIAGVNFSVIEVPGHTLDHIAYYSEEAALVFCGDTLFAGGCGRLFEGTPAQMHQSLSKLAKLPGETKVYCAHEYTLANLAFAKAVESGNAALIDRIDQASLTRQNKQPTVPTTIALENATNPFMRSHIPEVVESAKSHSGEPLNSGAEVLAAVRAWKDQF